MPENQYKDKYTNGYFISERKNVVLRMSAINSMIYMQSDIDIDPEERYSDLYINGFCVGSVLNNDKVKKLFVDKVLEFIDKNESVSFEYIEELLNLK